MTLRVVTFDYRSSTVSLTWKPEYVQEPILRKQVCASYGKYSTSIEQEDLYMAGGRQMIAPL